MSAPNSEGSVGGSRQDGDSTSTPMQVTQLFPDTPSDENVAAPLDENVAAPTVDSLAPRIITPPGIAAFKKCQTHTQYAHLIESAVSLLMAVKESGVCLVPKKSRTQTPIWNELMVTVFEGAKCNNGQRDGNGVFRAYAPWVGSNPLGVKFKPLVQGIIKQFAEAYESRDDPNNATVLEVLAYGLSQDMAEAEKEKVEKADLAYAQKLQNETAEESLGFTSMGVGVGCSSGVRLGQAEKEGLALLGQATASISTVPASIFVLIIVQYYSLAVAAAAQLVAATPEQPPPDAKRSRAEKEAALALMSAKKVKTTKHTIDARPVKTAHNMDIVHVNDGLLGALDAKTDRLFEFMESLQPSPDSKTQKKIESATRQISAVLAEIKQLSDMNEGGMFDNELSDRHKALKSLYDRRKALEKSMQSSCDEIVLD